MQWRVVALESYAAAHARHRADDAAKARAKRRWSLAATRLSAIGAIKSGAVARRGGSRMALCYLCGALNPAVTFAHHLKSCASKWTKAHAAAAKRAPPPGGDRDDDDPGPLPPNPHARVDFAALDLEALEVANEASQAAYFAHALVECPHCKRRFRRPALRKHRAACTAARPFAAPLARRKPDAPRAPRAWA